jgi:hypothetical protein
VGTSADKAVVKRPSYVEGLAADGADDTDSSNRVRAEQPIWVTLRKTHAAAKTMFERQAIRHDQLPA